MALAKYLEDIEERWLDDTEPRFEKQLSAILEFTPRSVEIAGEVYLKRNGRRMEDVEIYNIGETLSLEIQCPERAAKPIVKLLTVEGYEDQRQTIGGRIIIKFDKTGTQQLQVASGAYIKSYTLNVVEPLAPDTLPDFAKLIQNLAENPPKWNSKSFGEFRVEVESILRESEVPQMFANGIIEYHLSLFHEEREIPQYNDRLEAAYGALRWFAPYSDLARLVCTFFLYRANEFVAARRTCRGRFVRMDLALDFFCGIAQPNCDRRSAPHSHSLRSPSLFTDSIVIAIVCNAYKDHRPSVSRGCHLVEGSIFKTLSNPTRRFLNWGSM
jgi:hypothetical protein